MQNLSADRPGTGRILPAVLLPALLGALGLLVSSLMPHGSAGFYFATFFTAAVYVVTWALTGRRTRDGHGGARVRPIPELLRGLVIGLVLLGVFALGALVVRGIPLLAEPVDGLLENARQGPLALTVLTTAVNGGAEELFFRRTVPRNLPGTPVRADVVAVLLYLVVTAFMGVPLLVLAALAIGALAQYEARRSGALWSPVVLHLAWSLGMLVVLPPLFLG